MMECMEIIEDRSTYYAINVIIELLSKVSVDTFVTFMDKYAKTYALLAEWVWKEEYLKLKEAGEASP